MASGPNGALAPHLEQGLDLPLALLSLCMGALAMLALLAAERMIAYFWKRRKQQRAAAQGHDRGQMAEDEGRDRDT
jgi:hypothetical protein